MSTPSPTTVPCPYCDAPAGKPCVTASGNLARTHIDAITLGGAA